jgi:hypothetical protein
MGIVQNVLKLKWKKLKSYNTSSESGGRKIPDKKEDNMRIKLLQGKHFYGDCGSSNWREAGEIFEAKIDKVNECGIESETAEIRTSFMQHSIKLYNNDFQKEFIII